MNGKIYSPIGCACADIINKDTLRCYTQRPTRPSSSSSGYYSYTYYDIYITEHYNSITGTSNFYYNSTLPICSANSRLTTDIYYRYDMTDILIIFTIIVIFGFGIPWYLFKRFFKKGSRL